LRAGLIVSLDLFLVFQVFRQHNIDDINRLMFRLERVLLILTPLTSRQCVKHAVGMLEHKRARSTWITRKKLGKIIKIMATIPWPLPVHVKRLLVGCI